MSQTQNHFELFGLPVSFEIDLQDLSERYRHLQAAVHPDRYVNASDRERRLSVEKSALINDAFQILKLPQRRARYMLELQSVSFNDEQDTALDSRFLMEQIELREALAELKNSDDPVVKLNAIMADIKTRTSVIIKELSELLKNTLLDEQQKEAAKSRVQKMQFLNKLQQEAEYQEENLIDVL